MPIKIIAILGGAVFALATLPALASHPVNVRDDAQISLGKKIYQENCISCHGVNREGPEDSSDFGKRKPPRLNAKGHGARHEDQIFFDQIVEGSRDKSGKAVDDGMPPFGDTLSKEEIWAMITYIKSHWPKDMQMKQNMLNPGHGMGKESKPHQMKPPKHGH